MTTVWSSRMSKRAKSEESAIDRVVCENQVFLFTTQAFNVKPIRGFIYDGQRCLTVEGLLRTPSSRFCQVFQITNSSFDI